MKKTVLITGVAGLLGSKLAQYLTSGKAGNIQVIGIDDLSGGLVSNIPGDVIFKYGDVAGDTLEQLFETYQPDIVYHFAAYAAECLSPYIRKYNYQNNLIATANIINCCIKYKVDRLVFTSSMAVYGHAEPPFSEDMTPLPVDPYGVAKYAAELDIQIAGEQHDLDWTIIRPHNVYGPNQNIWDPYRNFLGICMYKTLVGDPITIYGDGLQMRAFSYIDDSLAPMWEAGISDKASRQIINLGGIYETTILETAEMIQSVARRMGLDVPDLIFLPPRHEVKIAFSTYEKSVDLLNFEHKTNLDVGITKMWDWVLKEPWRERNIWNSYEIEDGIYPYWKREALEDGYWNEYNSNNTDIS